MGAHGNGSATGGRAARYRILDERGIALPMALIFLGLLTMLMLAFGVLGQSEGLITSNHMLMTQARANAESGFQQALWALNACVKNDPPPAGCLPNPLPDPTPAPYDGSTFVDPGATGGYFVLVTGLDDNDRMVTSRGCVPNCEQPRAQRIVQSEVEWFPPITQNIPAPFSVCGPVAVGGTALIDGRACGKPGAWVAGAINEGGNWGNAKIYGDGHDPSAPNQEGVDYVSNAPEEQCDEFTLKEKQLDYFRELAKLNGTYFGPGSPNGTPAGSPDWSGEVVFNSSNKLKDGIVFIDTVSGNNIPEAFDQQNPADFAGAYIHGNPFIGRDNDGVFHGVIIVNGSLQISGGMKIEGLVYTVNDFVYNGTGSGRIDGFVVSQNIRDAGTTVSEVESLTDGNSRINPSDETCDGDFAPWGFKMKAGTYRELEGDSL